MWYSAGQEAKTICVVAELNRIGIIQKERIEKIGKEYVWGKLRSQDRGIGTVFS